MSACKYHDPHCPCQDGDACHYEDCGDTKAMDPRYVLLARIAELERTNLPTYHDVLCQRDAYREELRLANAKLATDHVDFYEREFYPLSNFSAFELRWRNRHFATSEHAYHWEKFENSNEHQFEIFYARSAHDAFKYAEAHRADRRPDWNDVKVSIMLEILRAKAGQHEYVRRKLLETGDRELIECSWRDDFWGWGPNCDGQNMLGKLWMQIRSELSKALAEGGEHG